MVDGIPFFNLTGKTAFITGASSGIGRCIADVYARAGASVWIADVDEAGAETVRKAIESQGGCASFVRCDVTKTDVVEDAVEAAVQKDGKIDILVNNAGVGFVGSLLSTPEEDYDRIMEVNVKGIYHVSKVVLPYMIEKKNGVILNMASIASLIAVEDRFAYCASKGAVLQMSRSIALDFVDDGIRCNCICPTRIHTPFVDAYIKKNYPGKEREMIESLSNYQPMGRMGKPEEVAYLALYLASDEASFHTGEAFPIAGGKLMG